MELREATQNDLESVAAKSISQSGCREFPATIDYLYALEHEGKILGVGGLKILNSYSAWAWFDLSEDALCFKVKVYRTIRDWLSVLADKLNLRRIMAAVDVDFEEGIRTANHLGFQKESVMKNFLGNKDAGLYIRLF